MSRLWSPLAAALCVSCAYSPLVWAQAPAPASVPAGAALEGNEEAASADGVSSNDIIVIADPDGSFRISADRMHDMIEAFRRDRDRFAPQSSLLVRIRARSGVSTEGIAAHLRRGDEEIQLDVDANGLATIPVAMLGDGRWQLVVTRAIGSLVFSARVFSPGITQMNRRVGDLRLECRVLYGFFQQRLNIVQRGLYNLVGGCSTSRFALYYRTDRPLASASVEGRTEPLQLSRTGDSYRLPIADRSIPNDARIILTYRN